MNIIRKSHWATAALLVVALAVIAPPAQANDNSAQVIIDWDRIAQQNIGVPPFAPFAQARSYAMVHIAMADAVIAIQGRYDPFFAKLGPPVPPGASAKAAAAQAAHDVLVALVPANEVTLDAELATSLRGIPAGQRSLGRKVGKKIAAQVLAWRETDGFADANPQPPVFPLAILPSTLPGIWRPTLPALAPAQFSKMDEVAPFGLISPTQFLPAPFPQLESEEYATDFNDVKDNGGTIDTASTTRTPRQRELAQLFAGAPGDFANVTNFFRVWHNVARDVSLAQGMSMVRTARMFALLSASMFDSIQTSQVSKFVYRLWRPLTAVVEAGIDNNDATEAALDWLPLLGTPPYPSHASNASCLGASAAQTLNNVFGTDAKSFTATWYNGASPPEVVSSEPYDSFWAMGHDTGSSRIWGGIHFRFEITASENSCTQVANYIFDNYMQRQ